MPNVHFSFRRGAGDVPEILYGKVEIKPTLAFARGTSLVLPAPTTLDLVNGEATANNVYPTPAPVAGQVEWAYRVKAIDTRGQSFEWMVGVPDGTGTVEFASLPRYFETKPPLFGKGEKGDPGEAAKITVGTVTGGATASVTNTGTNQNAVLDFVLPKGDKGDRGDGVPPGGAALQYIRKDVTGAVTEWATLDKVAVGLTNVDNTADADKPLSQAQKTYVDQSNTLAYKSRTVAAKPSEYPEGQTTFVGSTTDGWPIVTGGSPAFVNVTTQKPRGYNTAIQYAFPFQNSNDDQVFSDVLYRIGYTTVDSWSSWKTFATTEELGQISARRFGAKGDGVTDDTAALQALIDSSSLTGKTAVLSKGASYVISGVLNLPEGVTFDGMGSTLLVPTLYGNVAFSFQGNNATLKNIRVLQTTVTGTTDNTRGLAATARTGLTLDNVTIEATQPGAGAGNLNRTGIAFTDCSELTLRNVRVKNFDYPTAFVRVQNVSWDGIYLENYVRGLYMTEIKTSVFRRGVIKGLSPNSNVQPGHNGVLIGTETSGGTDGVLLENITVDGSGEHGFRIGSFITVRNVKHQNCISINAGASGFKVLGGQTGGTSYHEDITYLDCTSIDAGNITDMTAGFMVQFVRRAKVVNPTVIKRNKTYSAAYGVEFQAVDGILIENPIIRDTENAGIKMGFVLGDITDVTISGGTITNSNGHGIWFDYTNRTLRRVKVVNHPTITTSGSGYCIHITNGASGTAVGAGYLSWYSTQGAGLQVSPDSTTVVFACNAIAAFDSALHGAMFRNGSQWSDPNLSTGQVRFRVGSVWKTPVYA